MDGMQMTMLAADVCVKDIGNGNPVTCRPRYGNSCPSDMYQCHLPMQDAALAGIPSGLCSDTWKVKKCRRKHTKNKCHKKKVARNCVKTCTRCQPLG